MNDPFDHVIAEAARTALTRMTGDRGHFPAERAVADAAVPPAGGGCHPGRLSVSRIEPET
ncbi:hypothetical protein ACFYNL_05325 [Streptomyces sp. NPDC007808]|uniref:hypothetical protein n=1 Tax=Streptomyces sp. NPDC007808 TaxID=3364779 RepID=UPI0036B75BF4